MKRILIVLLLIVGTCSLKAAESQRSKVALNMIVKNEAHVIERCLESVLPLIDYWVIVDTGSTDGTQDVIRNYMAQRNIPGELHERPWINFAHNRNEALELARPQADYLLIMDADDILTYTPGYKRPVHFDKEAYYTRINYSGTFYDRMQLINTKVPFRWIGVVHEVLVCETARDFAYLDGVTMKIIGGGGRSRDPDKFLRDAELLEADLLSDPGNSRSMFYLAQSYRDANLLDEALDRYQKRVEMGGWNEEVFWSLYQIALIQERLDYPYYNVIASYYKAFDYRPIRAEPLYRIASLHRRNNEPQHGLCVAKLALNITQPHDLIFVESWAYDFGLLFEYSLCASLSGLYQEAFNASMKLLGRQDLPENMRSLVELNVQTLMQQTSQMPAIR